jgi:hypothetical protein
MTSEFIVHNAAGYEQLMGRWSQKLAPQFIEFAGIERRKDSRRRLRYR